MFIMRFLTSVNLLVITCKWSRHLPPLECYVLTRHAHLHGMAARSVAVNGLCHSALQIINSRSVALDGHFIFNEYRYIFAVCIAAVRCVSLGSIRCCCIHTAHQGCGCKGRKNARNCKYTIMLPRTSMHIFRRSGHQVACQAGHQGDYLACCS